MNLENTKKEQADIIQWDVKNWSKCLSFWNEHATLDPSKKVLALGEREGGLSLYFALRGNEVICSDYNEMPEKTLQMHQEYSVSDRISYQKVDMKAIPFEDASIDIIVFKSVIGALGNAADQQQAMSEIYRVLKPGGTFLFAENLKGSRFHQWLRKKFVSWGERWRYISENEMKQWGNQYQTLFTKSYGVLALFGRSEKQRRFLARFGAILLPLTPKNWRYILFGVFIK